MKRVDSDNMTSKYESLRFGSIVFAAELDFENLSVITMCDTYKEYTIKISDLEKAFDEYNYCDGEYILPILVEDLFDKTEDIMEATLRYKMLTDDDISVVFTGIIQYDKGILSDKDMLIAERINLSEFQKLYDLVIHAKHITSLIK